ncbi:helix-turn-helix transcriptional regulator [Rhodococcus pyridinivorans]|uniref:helix-turn-helix transcriptional regulator n=1 Tax=Rhodococcus pyridinivorans TaxID=103816 RepID=UPI00265AAE86|nr:helix-turn-helix domain-containing protein [Rhodococcus pyridinivorans]
MNRYLSLGDVAVRTGLTVNTLKGYARKGILPAPDATIGSHRGWRKETIDRWLRTRLHADRPAYQDRLKPPPSPSLQNVT